MRLKIHILSQLFTSPDDGHFMTTQCLLYHGRSIVGSIQCKNVVYLSQ